VSKAQIFYGDIYDILLCLNHSITYGCPKGDVRMIYPTTSINHLYVLVIVIKHGINFYKLKQLRNGPHKETITSKSGENATDS